MTQKLSQIEKESCSTTLVDPKTVFEPHSEPKYSPLESQKVRNNPKIMSKSNDRIEGNIETDICSTTWEDPKSVVEPYSDPQTRPLGPQKDKNDPKIKSNSNSKIQWIIEMKAGKLHELIPKLFLNHKSNPKLAY